MNYENYRVIIKRDLSELEREVNDLIDFGWVCLGPPQYLNWDRWVQAMLKGESPNKEKESK